MKAILTVIGKDKVGIVAGVSAELAQAAGLGGLVAGQHLAGSQTAHTGLGREERNDAVDGVHLAH